MLAHLPNRDVAGAPGLHILLVHDTRILPLALAPRLARNEAVALPVQQDVLVGGLDAGPDCQPHLAGVQCPWTASGVPAGTWRRGTQQPCRARLRLQGAEERVRPCKDTPSKTGGPPMHAIKSWRATHARHQKLAGHPCTPSKAGGPPMQVLTHTPDIRGASTDANVHLVIMHGMPSLTVPPGCTQSALPWDQRVRRAPCLHGMPGPVACA